MPDAEAIVSELAVDSSYDSLTEVTAFVEREAKRAGACESDLLDVVMSATEAVNNAIQHGNREASGKKVLIRMECTARRIVLWVKDEGSGFNEDAVADATEPGNLLRDSGRGILMMKAFMDEVDFGSWEMGTSVRMVKALSPGQE